LHFGAGSDTMQQVHGAGLKSNALAATFSNLEKYALTSSVQFVIICIWTTDCAKSKLPNIRQGMRVMYGKGYYSRCNGHKWMLNLTQG
jgi:hypothetical protein